MAQTSSRVKRSPSTQDKPQGLTRGALSPRTAHLCIDMQELFRAETAWHTPWMEKVLPEIVKIAEAHPAQSIFTRFIPPAEPTEMSGSWRAFYERWREMTRNHLNPALLELVEPLREIARTATVIDKRYFSPFHGTNLAALLRQREVDTLVVTGAETDMCVLAAVLDGVDQGLRIVIPVDALCSSSDEMHEALLALYRTRFSCQIETSNTDVILTQWER